MSTPLTSLVHNISVNDARTLISNYVELYNSATSPSDLIVPQAMLSRSQSFEGNQVLALLNQSGVIGLRCYFGLYPDGAPNNNAGKIVIILCGVDEDGNDFHLDPSYSGPDPIIMEDGQLCPLNCPAPSKINNL